MDFFTYIICLILVFAATGLLILVAASIGNFFIILIETVGYNFARRKLSIFGYRCFYTNTESIDKDEKSRRILSIVKELYVKDSSFNPFCQRLSESRLPLPVILNWARSISEDLFASPIPSVKLDQWNHYWNSKLYRRVSFFHDDFPLYEEHELGCLWGAVYIWLAIIFEKDIYDSLMVKIARLGCREKTAIPYFRFFYDYIRKNKGEDYYIAYNPQMFYPDGQNRKFCETQCSVNITSEDIYKGFELLSVNERRNARKVLNDVLDECGAWRMMCSEMKSRGWFRENIYPTGETNVITNACYIGNDAHIDQMAVGDYTSMNHQ